MDAVWSLVICTVPLCGAAVQDVAAQAPEYANTELVSLYATVDMEGPFVQRGVHSSRERTSAGRQPGGETKRETRCRLGLVETLWMRPR